MMAMPCGASDLTVLVRNLSSSCGRMLLENVEGVDAIILSRDDSLEHIVGKASERPFGVHSLVDVAYENRIEVDAVSSPTS